MLYTYQFQKMIIMTGFVVQDHIYWFVSINPFAPFWTFLSILVFFFDNFACVNANCINFGSGVYLYWYFNIPPSFPLINLFYTRYNKIVTTQCLLDKNVPIETH